MRIMFIVTRADAIGGVQVHVRDVSSALRDRGHDVVVVTGPEGRFTEALRQAGVATVECPTLLRAIDPRSDARALASLRRQITACAPDLVSTHSSKAGILGRLACMGGPPCIFTAHGWAFTEGVTAAKRRVYQAIERSLAPLSARIICVSEHDRLLGLKAGIRAERLVTIHNGMPDDPRIAHADPGATGPMHVVMVARFDDQKDHRTLLRAAAAVDEVVLDLVGEGPNLAQMQRAAADLGIANRVHFWGHLGDVSKVLAAGHTFALISHWEGFPRSTLEAMRAGLPTIASDVGGSREAVVAGVTGFIVPRSDEDALESALRQLATNASLRAMMGQAARDRFASHFTFRRMFDQTTNLYAEITGLPV